MKLTEEPPQQKHGPDRPDHPADDDATASVHDVLIAVDVKEEDADVKELPAPAKRRTFHRRKGTKKMRKKKAKLIDALVLPLDLVMMMMWVSSYRWSVVLYRCRSMRCVSWPSTCVTRSLDSSAIISTPSWDSLFIMCITTYTGIG